MKIYEQIFDQSALTPAPPDDPLTGSPSPPDGEPSPEGQDGLERLRRFFLANGYLEHAGAHALEPPAQGGHAVVLVRGSKGAGWWESDLTALWTWIGVESSPEKLRLHYRVDVGGQHLTEEDRQFWQREGRKALQVARGEAPVVDLRPVEKLRAERISSRYQILGVGLAVLAFVSIVALALLGII